MSGIGLMAILFNCYVGSNTGSPDLQALHVLSCDAVRGDVRLVQSVKGIQGTTYFQLDRSGEYLYSVVAEPGTTTSSTVRFPVGKDGRLGPLQRLACLPCETPCHISLSADGSRLFTASYRSATVCSQKIDGTDLRTYVFPDDAMGPNVLRQKKAYAHFTFMTPDGARLGAVDLGCDRIRFFDPVTLAVDAALEIKAQPGEGPRHAVWSKDGRYLFVINELASSVASYAYDGRSFRRVGAWSTLPEGFNRWENDGKTLATKAAAIRLTVDGKMLLASNRGYDSIAVFAVDEARGMLECKKISNLEGRFPRDFALMPGEQFAVVGHKLSDEVRVYRFDRNTGALTPIGAPLHMWRPLCFEFARGVR